MESLDYWRLYPELTIEQAAPLAVDIMLTPDFDESIRRTGSWLQELKNTTDR